MGMQIEQEIVVSISARLGIERVVNVYTSVIASLSLTHFLDFIQSNKNSHFYFRARSFSTARWSSVSPPL
jgi:ribosomal protein L19